MSADKRRRTVVSLPLLAAGAAWGGSAFAQPAPDTGGDSQGAVRLALLVGNRVYPDPFDLPPAYKNVRDLAGVLERRGFKVTSVLDQNPAQLHSAIQAFAKVAADTPPNATILFYYTGHGMQVDAENLMLGSGVPPDSREDTLLNSSLHLRRDVIDQLPRRAGGLTIAVVDACRTSLRAALKATDGFNQVEAPLGCLIVFSTGAGKPAIAPAVETLNTFYTASLVKLLTSAADETSFSDLFRLVKFDVTQTMQNFPVKEIRQFTQIPFIAENTQVRFQLALRSATQATTPQFNAAEEAAAWRELEEDLWPADIVRLSEAYLQRYPSSKLAGGAQVAHEGAADAVRALRSNEVRLFRSAFQPKTTEPRWLSEWRKAARGDKDAAARIARAYLHGEGDIGVDPNRYEGWMQYAAALGNGIASYELAVYYRRQAQPVPAAQYETRARDLGYTPPTSLDNQRK
ncbi:MAG TPA: caspase family protein [Caldimonas sp.]|nr:caspase family protein [Caldimonas sp.]